MTPMSLTGMYKQCLFWVLSKLFCFKFQPVTLPLSSLIFIKLYSQTPLLIITDSLLCPRGKKAQLHFTFRQYGHFLWPPQCLYQQGQFDRVIISFRFSGHWFLALIYNLPFLVGKARMDKNSRRCVVELFVDNQMPDNRNLT